MVRMIGIIATCLALCAVAITGGMCYGVLLYVSSRTTN